MTTHLSSGEFVDAVEGVLPAERRTHLEGCDACRRDVDELRGVLGDVECTSEIPEPSPLFWQHFSERVRQATVDEPVPAPRGWWAGAWRPMVAAAAGLVVLVIVVMPRSTPDVALPEVTVTENASLVGEAPVDDGTWDLIAGIASASGLAWEDVQQVARPRTGTADALISTLTPAERSELARMLRAEIGDVE
jgi:hypothetical protein